MMETIFHLSEAPLKMPSPDAYVVVAVSTDEFNELKGKKTLIPYEQRAEIVQAICYVDKVIPEESWEQKIDDVKQYAIDIFAIGEDWRGDFDFLEEYCEVVYLERTKDISTTELKRSLNSFLSVPREDLIQAFETLELLRKQIS